MKRLVGFVVAAWAAAGGLVASTTAAEPSHLGCEDVGTSSFPAQACRTEESRETDGARDTVLRTRQGIEDFAAFSVRPPRERLEYTVRLPAGSRLEPAKGGAVVRDEQDHVRLRVEAPWLIDAHGKRRPIDLVVGACGGTRSASCELSVDWSALAVDYPITVDPQWLTVDVDGGQLCTGRQLHTASAIGAGSQKPGGVLIVGGRAVPYQLPLPVVDAGAALDASLDGGLDATVDASLVDGSPSVTSAVPQPTAAVELFDPSSQTVHECTALLTPRVYHTATWVNLPVLGSPGQTKGMLLIVGGYTSCIGHPCASGEVGPALDTYELYDADTSCNDTACVGGCSCPNVVPSAVPFLLPDGLPRAEHSATAMPAQGNNILVAGGTAGGQGAGAQALIFDVQRAFDPADPNGSWTLSGPSFGPMFGHADVYVPDPGGDTTRDFVLLMGGSSQPVSGDQANSAIRTGSLFVPSGGSLATIGRDGGASDPDSRPARTLSAGRLDGAGVLVWGGSDWTSPVTLDFTAFLQSQEPIVWKDIDLQTAGVPWTNYSVATDTAAIPELHGALMVGGISQNECASSANASYLGTQGWSSSISQLNVARVNHTVTPINGGTSLVAIGGESGDPCSASSTQIKLLSSLEVLAVGDQGSSCDAGSTCVTGHCANGVCCDKACDHLEGGTECQACNAQGFCLPEVSGTGCGPTNTCGERASCDGKDNTCPPIDAGVDACELLTDDGGPPIAMEAGPSPMPGPAPSDTKTFLSCAVGHGRGDPRQPLAGIILGGALLLRRRRGVAGHLEGKAGVH